MPAPPGHVDNGFRFRDMAEVERAIALEFSGTLNPVELQSYIVQGTILMHIFHPHSWKIKKLRDSMTGRKMQETWLTQPYTPRMPSKPLP
jgi:hypothetical protein